MRHFGKRIPKIISAIFLFIIILSIVIGYSHYLELKKALVLRLSQKATLLLGQRVDIGDISFSLPAKIGFYDIGVKNPDGIREGELLRIKRILLDMRLMELLRGRLSFRGIETEFPELSLIIENNAILNLSDKLIQFLSRKTTIRYRIDEFRISSGSFDVNRNTMFSGRNINISLKDLSSQKGIRTLVNGAISYGKSEIRVDGWAYPKDETKNFSLYLSSGDIDLAPMREAAKRYGIDLRNMKISVNVNVGGDTMKGFKVTSKTVLKGEGMSPFIKGTKDIRLDLDVFFDPGARSVEIRDISVYLDNILSVRLDGAIAGIPGDPSYSGGMKIYKIDLSFFDLVKGSKIGGLLESDRLILKGKFGRAMPEMSGIVKLKNGSLKSLAGNKTIANNIGFVSKIMCKGGDCRFTSDLNVGKVSVKFSGEAKRLIEKDMSLKIKATLNETKLTDIRNSFWDSFPDGLLYAGLEGFVSSEVFMNYSSGGLKVSGDARLKDIFIKGENGEYSAGPINGLLPIRHDKAGRIGEGTEMPSFERPEFSNLVRHYSGQTFGYDYRRITIGALSYGFRILDDIDIRIKQTGNILNIAGFSANIFDGRLYGAADVDFSDGLSYKAGMLLEGLSLTKLCDEIEPIKGYISGKIDGVATMKGSGKGLSGLIGKAEFWTYSSDGEKTKISREFLQKVGGPSMKAYIGDRKFNKGVMSIYLQDGFVIFKELEISNRNMLGIKDLDVRVAPFNNRIEIGHLMWAITEAAQRAKEK